MLVWFLLLGRVIPGYANTSSPAIIEVVKEKQSALNAGKLEVVCKKYHILNSAIYQWKNHWVIYSSLSNVNALRRQLAAQYPRVTVKTYQHPFYNFERKHCSSITVAKQWDNIILTANLVKNTKLQQEYLNYHATQFKKWPMVAQGFCNAGFQQLQVFKNGRQLMLVISIPKGASLDNLNLKTTEHNPQMVKWNTIMKKYQEGISGTQPGEVWVFFKPLS
ncbi:L-rhamnose mutarotase [Mucilaginibacter robiniae]|nr:L-rhamnose mutarotase [Mucilaginibacter robiniae]